MLESICSKYEHLKPKLIVLFGSHARGDYTDESDIDLLVVSDVLPRDPRQSFEELFDPEEPRITPIGLNTEVFLSKLRKGEPFILEILEDGRVLCVDEKFYEEIAKVFTEVRRKYVRRGKAWIRVSEL